MSGPLKKTTRALSSTYSALSAIPESNSYKLYRGHRDRARLCDGEVLRSVREINKGAEGFAIGFEDGNWISFDYEGNLKTRGRAEGGLEDSSWIVFDSITIFKGGIHRGRSSVQTLAQKKADEILESINAGGAGKSVIGPRSIYKQYAKDIGANFLDVTNETWSWAKNLKYLKGIVERGDDVYLPVSSIQTY